MPPTMSKRSKEQLLKTVRYHYQRTTSKRKRGQWLDKLCELGGWERKHAIKLLGGQRGPLRLARLGGPARGPRGGSSPKYGAVALGILKALWLCCEQPCGKRLKAVVPLWLPGWERRHGPCQWQVRQQLLSMSAAQMDRRLRVFKVQGSARRPAPGCSVRSQVPLRTGPWEVKDAGWIEADTVAHCGGNMGGSFAWSLVLTDIHSQWTEARATWNRSDRAIHQRMSQIEAGLPFEILGMDTDNGGEFINGALLRHWRERARPVVVTRSRPYRKNDNAHVEQKNRTHIRALLGHERRDVQQAVESHNQLLIDWSLWNNLYSPSLKLQSKAQDARSGRWKKLYEKEARTPAQRLLQDAKITPAAKARLRSLLEKHDPLELKESIEKQLRALSARPRVQATAIQVDALHEDTPWGCAA